MNVRSYAPSVSRPVGGAAVGPRRNRADGRGDDAIDRRHHEGSRETAAHGDVDARERREGRCEREPPADGAGRPRRTSCRERHGRGAYLQRR